jgi:transcriptional regulator with XRE-family HTH domain
LVVTPVHVNEKFFFCEGRMPDTLKIWIIRSGKTQRLVARAIGRSEGWVSDLVHGWVKPTPEDQQALSRTLGQPIDVLFAKDAALAEGSSDRA